jgi:hypothetical protein
MASKLIPIYADKQEIVQDSKVEITWNMPTNNNVIDVKVDEISNDKS